MALDLSDSGFKKTLIYEARASVPEVLADLALLGQWDQRVEAKRRRVKIAAWISALCVPLCFAAFAFASSFPYQTDLADYGCPVSSVFLVLMVALIIVHKVMGHGDLDNRRYGLVATLLQRLEVDLEPGAPVALKLDLAPVDAKRKFVHEDKRSGWKCKHYADPWLDLQGRFTDGTHLSVSMLERLQKRSRTKRTSRGKYKTKFKQKGHARMVVALRVKPGRYPGLEALGPQAKQATRLPAGLVVDRLDVTGERAALRVVLPQDWTAPTLKPTPGDEAPAPKPVPVEKAPTAKAGRSKAGKPAAPVKPDAARAATMMLLSLYQVLNFSHSQRKRGNLKATP